MASHASEAASASAAPAPPRAEVSGPLEASADLLRHAFEHAPVGLVLADPQGRVITANGRWRQISGYTGPLPLDDARPLLHPDDRDRVSHAWRSAVDSQEPFDMRARMRSHDGGVRNVHMRAAPVYGVDGSVVGYAASILDLTALQRVTEEAVASESRLRSLAEALPVGVYRSNGRGRLTFVNPRWSEITGVTVEEANRIDPMSLVHEDDRMRVQLAVEASWETGEPHETTCRLTLRDGSTRWVQSRSTVIRDSNGDPTASIGSIEDITALVAAHEQTRRLATIVESTSDLVAVLGTDDEVIYLNRAARDVLGVGDAALADMRASELFTAESFERLVGEIEPVLERNGSWNGELGMVRRDGTEIQILQSIVADRRPPRGSVTHLSIVGRDVTDRRRMEAELAHQATHDPLTGLPNRSLLLTHLDKAIARSKRDHSLIALLFCDLDRFKAVNDNRGHDVGDELLRQVARRIASVLRPQDTVARLGGDEFVVLFDQVEDENYALAAAQRVCASIETRAFSLPSIDLNVTVSAGIALSADVEHPEALLRDADAAMYRAKDGGRARLELYDEEMRTKRRERREMAADLSHAIEQGDIEVHYQPVVNLRSGELVGIEALARWRHDGLMLDPTDFIPLAEDTGLIVGVGLTVLHQACEQAVRWRSQMGNASPTVHVNLSARQLTHGNLPALVRGVLDRVDLPADHLCLEITESVLMDKAVAAEAALHELSAVGVRLAIDDFGTGYSSLSYLRRFPVDVLKIDRSFIDGLGPEEEDSAITAAIVSLAHTLGLTAVAEGVETVEQFRELQALGCDAAQGFLFAHPAPADSIGDFLNRDFPV